MPDEERVASLIEALLDRAEGRLLNAAGSPNTRGEKLLTEIKDEARRWIETRIAAVRPDDVGGGGEEQDAPG